MYLVSTFLVLLEIKLAELGPRDRKTPCAGDFNQLSKDDETMSENDWTKFRSCVGKLLYVASERPDCQCVVQGLASFMQKPTKKAWKALRHLCSYLRDTKYDGLLLCNVTKGISALNTKGVKHEDDADEQHRMEVICDADYAGNGEQKVPIIHPDLSGWKSHRVLRAQSEMHCFEFSRVRVRLHGRRSFRRFVFATLLEISMW